MAVMLDAVPVLPIAEDEFELRRDAVLAMKEAGIVLPQEVFVPPPHERLLQLHQQARLRLVLVDHNELSEATLDFKESVVQIVDHHADSKIEYPNLESKLIERVGSCCTLVARLLRAQPAMKDFIQQPEIVKLLAGTVLLDTQYFNAERVTFSDEDRSMVENLPRDQLDSYYTRLKHARADLTGFSVLQKLFKDLKTVRKGSLRIAIPSVSQCVDLKTESWAEAALQLAQRRQADAVVIQSAHVDAATNRFSRNLVIVSENEALTLDLIAFLRNETSLWSSDCPANEVTLFRERPDLIVVDLGRICDSASRKVTLPLIQRFVEERSGIPSTLR